jgi:hypothetical protein
MYLGVLNFITGEAIRLAFPILLPLVYKRSTYEFRAPVN